MKLLKYNNYDDITNKITGAEKVVYKWSDTLDVDYTELTSIEDIDNYGFNHNKDYYFVRNQIRDRIEQKSLDTIIGTHNDPTTLTPSLNDKYLIDIGVNDWLDKDNMIAIYNGTSWDYKSIMEDGFNLSNSSEKDVISKYKIGETQQILNYLGDINTLINYDSLYDININKSILTRFAITKTLFEIELPDDYYKILDDNGTDQLITNLVVLNIIGTHAGDKRNGLSDYIDITLRSKPWTPINYTLDDLCNKCIDILVNGNY